MNAFKQPPDPTPFPMDPSHGNGCSCAHEKAAPGILDSAGRSIQIFILVSAIIMAVFQARSEAFISFCIIFSSIVLEAFPFMLLGTLLGGFVEVFLSREQFISILPKNKTVAIVCAAFLGIFFPVCECAIVPVVRKFLQKGMPLGSAVTFLLAGPIVNPLVFASTLVAYTFDFKVAFLRTAAGLVIAIAAGLFINAVIREKDAVIPGSSHSCAHCGHDHPARFAGKIKAALFHGAADFYDIGRFLIMGALIAATLQTMVDRQVFLSPGTVPLVSIGAMMVLAFVLNLCSEADAFICASFRPMGIPLSAQLAFMVLGPMLDIKLILMYLGLFTRKMILLLCFFVVMAVFAASVVMEVLPWI